MTQFYGKTKICYGDDALEVLEKLPVKSALIVTDPFMMKTGFVDIIKSHLDRGGITYRIFDQIEPDPSLETVTQGSVFFLQNPAESVITLGGGSAIDAAKAIVFFAHKARGGDVKPLLVAIPTTSGTGAEVTAISVVTDKVNQIKIPLNDELLIPDIAILDARFTRTLPPSITSVTGMDVLTHAIEAYTSRRANAFTGIYAEYAIRYVFQYLFRAFQCKDDMKAREMMLLASCMSGLAFNNSGLGITHSIAHSLGGLFHIPHGLANALVLPHVIRYNSFNAGVQYKEISQMLLLPAGTIEEGTMSLIKAVCDLTSSMGIPQKIRELKVDEAVFKASAHIISENVMDDICTVTNARTPSCADIKVLLEQIW